MILTISPYYIRDTRLYEIYITLHYTNFLIQKGSINIDTNDVENNFLRQIGTTNNRNWRNAFISLKSLGFLNDNNCLTQTGFEYVKLNYESFLKKITTEYISPFFKEVFQTFSEVNLNRISNSDLVENIRKRNNGNDIKYLTQSDNRYISSWLNILIDDFGCISYERNVQYKNIQIIYNPLEFSYPDLTRTKGHHYINEYLSILGSI